jgi:agmatine deiminase
LDFLQIYYTFIKKIQYMQKSLLKISIFLSLALLVQTNNSFAQTEENLPVGFSAGELEQMSRSDFAEAPRSMMGITTPPAGPLRTMAQWEESGSLFVTWRSYESVLREIVRNARLECTVYIHCNTVSGNSAYKDSTAIKSYLTAGGVSLSNIKFIPVSTNSVWQRDFGATTVYMNDVDSMILCDWHYNRPTRPQDDASPNADGPALNVPVYNTTSGSNDLINTGGNWICDGMGTSLHSNLIMTDNPGYSVSQVDGILSSFMGITRSIKQPTLPYDGIHHLDMHMKLINEETLLVGEYPSGVSDGPQIEANIAYITSTYMSSFGTPYKVVRIPQPPDVSTYPSGGGDYLTYTNATIINHTIIVPQYGTTYGATAADANALSIWRDAMPGYNVVGINSASTISASGSLHCITHEEGVHDPLRIVHQNLPNTTNTTTPYQVDAIIQHRTGIANANLYYTNDTTGGGVWSSAPMALTGVSTDTWTGFIPAYPAGTHIFYYIHAQAVSGKQQIRPMVAPAGNFEFDVLGSTGIKDIVNSDFAMKSAYPNPSHGITCIPVSFNKNTKGTIKLYDILGNLVTDIYEGEMNAGEKNYFLNSVSLNINAGAYLIVVETPEGRLTQKLMVR